MGSEKENQGNLCSQSVHPDDDEDDIKNLKFKRIFNY